MINIKIHQKRGGHKLHCHREEKMYEKKNSMKKTELADEDVLLLTLDSLYE